MQNELEEEIKIEKEIQVSRKKLTTDLNYNGDNRNKNIR